MKKLRLLVTKKCPRNCYGCCNNDYDLDELPIALHYNYDLIVITGGEPLCRESKSKTISLLMYLKYVDINNQRIVILYTATHDYELLNTLLKVGFIDGLTLTLHTQEDADKFINVGVKTINTVNKSLRLNIFSGIEIPNDVEMKNWLVKRNIEWIKDCPLPSDEMFMRTKTI